MSKPVIPDAAVDVNQFCKKCGGTGDKWNTAIDDWATPRKDCPACDGTGEPRG